MSFKYSPLSSNEFAPGAGDYSTSVSPENLLRDPRFLGDLREYYATKGKGGLASDEELIDQFYTDQTWGLLNTVSAGKQALEALAADPDQKQRINRIRNVANRIPKFWQKGGRGFFDAAGDIAPAVIFDPVNLAPGLNAYAKGANAARVASAAGKSARAAGISAGARAGAISEAAISAGQEAFVNSAHQLRDVQIGARAGFDVGEVAGSALLGGTVGAATGGVIGAGTGAFAANKGVNQADASRFLGLSPEEIQSLTPEQADELEKLADKAAPGPYITPAHRAQFDAKKVAEEPDEAAATPTTEPAEPIDPIDVEFKDADEKINASVQAQRELVVGLETDRADPDIIQEARDRLLAVTRLRGVVDRLRKEKEEIIELGETSDIASLKRRDARLAAFEEDFADLNVLLRQTDTLDPDELLRRATDANEKIVAEKRAAAEAESAAKAEAKDKKAPSKAETADGGDEPAELAETAATEPAEAPAVEPLASVSYRSDAQREAVQKILADSGATEEQLANYIRDGVVSVGKKDGKLTRQGVKEFRDLLSSRSGEAAPAPTEAADPAPTTSPDVDTPEADAPKISRKLRGEALAAGVDYRNLKPGARAKSGRVTAATLKKVVKEREADAGKSDELALQAQRDLDDILELTNKQNLSDDATRSVVAALARRSDVKTDAEDLLALYDHYYRKVAADSASDAPEISSHSKQPTITHTKRVKRLANQIRKENPDLSEEAAEAMAEASLQAEASRGAPIRGSGESAEKATVFTTAGRNAAGRIQGFLRKGSRIAKGSDYTTTGAPVRQGVFGFEEALIRARSGDGPDVVEYTLTGGQDVFTSKGKRRLKAGDAAFADALTGRSYESMELALRARGDHGPAPKAAELPEPTTENHKKIEALIEAGDDEALYRFLVGEDVETPAAPIPTAPEAIPLKRGDKLLIVRSVLDPSIVRMISRAQAREGKDIRALIGQNPDSPNSNPANWEVRYAPADQHTHNKKDLAALFESLPPEEAGSASARGGIYEAGSVTGAGRPLSADEASKVVLSSEDIGPAVLEAVSEALGHPVKFMRERGVTAGELLFSATYLEAAPVWHPTREALDTHIERLKAVYQALDEVAPQGILVDETTREASLTGLDEVLSAHPAADIEAARDFITRLGGDPARGPIIQRGADGNYRHRTQLAGGKPSDWVEIGAPGSTNILPATNLVYHEVAHWAYMNILTPTDRLEFWDIISRKFYDEDGNLDTVKRKEHLGFYSNMPFETVDANGGAVHGRMGSTGNTEESAQELFANQFDIWASRKHAPETTLEESYWRRITDYIKTIFDRYVKGAKIEPEFEPLFSKILPPKERDLFRLGVDANPTTEAGKQYHRRYLDLQLYRSDLEDAIERDSSDGIINASRELVRFLLETTPKGSKKSRPNTGVFGPFRRYYKIIHQRIDDIDEIIAGKPFDYDALKDGAVREGGWQDDGLTSHADPLAIGDLLADHFKRGYEGNFTPAKGVSVGIKRLDKTSVSALLDMLADSLEASYRRAESGQMVAGAKPKGATKRAGGSATAKKTVRKAKKVKERSQRAASADAKETASTPPSRRTSATSPGKSSADPQTAPELKTQSLDALRELYIEHRNTPRGDQIAIELVAKERAEPLPAKAVPIPKAVRDLSAAQLDESLLEALEDGDHVTIDQVTYEMRRRLHNKSQKKKGLPTLQPVYLDSKMVEVELSDNVGIPQGDGIPASARASVREFLSYITHRDAEVQQASRTIAYRLLNLVGRAARGTSDGANLITHGDVARISGASLSGPDSVPLVDYRAGEFKAFRTHARRLAVGLLKGGASPHELVGELSRLIIRADVVPERPAILEVFGTLGEEAADDWFATSVEALLAGRKTKDEIFAGLPGDAPVTASVRQNIGQALDRASEYAAYVTNGLIGRDSIKAQFRRLTIYGDMFAPTTRPPLGSTPDTALPVKMAADAVRDTLETASPARVDAISDFIQAGLSRGAGGQSFTPFYHVAKVGSRATEAIRAVSDGAFGPGVYLAANPAHAQSLSGSGDSFATLIETADIPADKRDELLELAEELEIVQKRITETRRASGADAAALPDLIEAEQASGATGMILDFS